jgi:hypothetical protein
MCAKNCPYIGFALMGTLWKITNEKLRITNRVIVALVKMENGKINFLTELDYE